MRHFVIYIILLHLGRGDPQGSRRPHHVYFSGGATPGSRRPRHQLFLNLGNEDELQNQFELII